MYDTPRIAHYQQPATQLKDNLENILAELINKNHKFEVNL